MGYRRTQVVIGSLDAHPNASEILGITSQLPSIADAELERLAAAWHNTTLLAEARRRALEPDSPMVIEALDSFETVQELFAEEMRGDADYLGVGPDVALTALKAVRDAIAAAYARPILTSTEHRALMHAWRAVYPTDQIAHPDLGARADDVTSLLTALPRLAARCHDVAAAADFASIQLAAARMDEDVRCAARDEAWHAAVLTSRRRVWHLVRRAGSEGLIRYCATCRQRRREPDTVRVVTLCIDAACGLLVAGALEDDVVGVLTRPVACLIPSQRHPG